MSQGLTIKDGILGTTNVMLVKQLIRRLENRTYGLPGMGTFSGEPGLGKTIASAHAASEGAIYVALEEDWTKKFFIEQILRELSVSQRGTTPALMLRLKEELALSGCTLIIDEVDYAVKKNYVETIRNIHDGTHAPIVLVGEEDLPQKLQKWPRFASRILSSVDAEYSDERDVLAFAGLYAKGISISNDMRAIILERNGGIARYIVNDLAHVAERCREWGVEDIDLTKWGQTRFAQNKPPKPRPRAERREVDINA